MAIYHCSIKNISRSSGKSAVASSSYRSGEELYDEELGKTFDYTRKQGIEYTEIILCKNAPSEYQDRETLWNAVEKKEKASDSRLAREWEVAIPKELSLENGQELVHSFGQSLADEGMCIDIAIHDKGDGNRHAHILGTTRAINEKGEWAPKSKKVYDLDEEGNRIPLIDKKTGMQKIDKQNRKQWKNHKEDYTDWNQTEKVEEWRGRWAEYCNRYLEKEQQIDHRSYERQGKEQIPTIHEGSFARKMEQRGKVSERCQLNRDIKEYNNLVQEQKVIEKLRDKLVKELKKLYERFEEIKLRRATHGSIGSNPARNGEPTRSDTKSTKADTGAFIRKLRAEERASEEERDRKIAERQARDIERERQRVEAQRRAEEAKREAEERQRRYRERSRDDGFEL